MSIELKNEDRKTNITVFTSYALDTIARHVYGNSITLTEITFSGPTKFNAIFTGSVDYTKYGFDTNANPQRAIMDYIVDYFNAKISQSVDPHSDDILKSVFLHDISKDIQIDTLAGYNGVSLLKCNSKDNVTTLMINVNKKIEPNSLALPILSNNTNTAPTQVNEVINTNTPTNTPKTSNINAITSRSESIVDVLLGSLLSPKADLNDINAFKQLHQLNNQLSQLELTLSVATKNKQKSIIQGEIDAVKKELEALHDIQVKYDNLRQNLIRDIRPEVSITFAQSATHAIASVKNVNKK